VEEEQQHPAESVIGQSVEKRNITAYHYGTGGTGLLFVGGIHGGYSWNTVLLAYQMMDYLKENPTVIPNNIKVTIIPVLNPDGLNKVVGTAGRFTQADAPSSLALTIPGRFNAHTVDLNRNFDCDWQASGKWQEKTVSGGDKAFSEPESQALKNYVETNKPTAVIAWFSAAGGVYASSCNGSISSETRAIMEKFAKASGYSAYKSFDFYKTTGDVTNWLAKNNISAISVILTNHTDTEWTKNQKGLGALLEHYAK
ncbi:MAG: M14 family zinc carboxypeptidase, partial [Parcubacteria group bacterium]